jgi:hypothetical protein
MSRALAATNLESGAILFLFAAVQNFDAIAIHVTTCYLNGDRVFMSVSTRFRQMRAAARADLRR